MSDIEAIKAILLALVDAGLLIQHPTETDCYCKSPDWDNDKARSVIGLDGAISDCKWGEIE